MVNVCICTSANNTKGTSTVVPVNTLSDNTSGHKVLNYVIIHGPQLIDGSCQGFASTEVVTIESRMRT